MNSERIRILSTEPTERLAKIIDWMCLPFEALGMLAVLYFLFLCGAIPAAIIGNYLYIAVSHLGVPAGAVKQLFYEDVFRLFAIEAALIIALFPVATLVLLRSTLTLPIRSQFSLALTLALAAPAPIVLADVVLAVASGSGMNHDWLLFWAVNIQQSESSNPSARLEVIVQLAIMMQVASSPVWALALCANWVDPILIRVRQTIFSNGIGLSASIEFAVSVLNQISQRWAGLLPISIIVAIGSPIILQSDRFAMLLISVLQRQNLGLGVHSLPWIAVCVVFLLALLLTASFLYLICIFTRRRVLPKLVKYLFLIQAGSAGISAIAQFGLGSFILVAAGGAFLVGGFGIFAIVSMLRESVWVARARSMQSLATVKRRALFLRPFVIDEARVPIRLPPMIAFKHWNFWSIRIEEVVAISVAGLFHMFGAGRPGEQRPALGSLREYFVGDDWRPFISESVEQAEAILFIVGKGKELSWETNVILEKAALRRTIFIVPPHAEEVIGYLHECRDLIGVEVIDSLRCAVVERNVIGFRIDNGSISIVCAHEKTDFSYMIGVSMLLTICQSGVVVDDDIANRKNFSASLGSLTPT